MVETGKCEGEALLRKLAEFARLVSALSHAHDARDIYEPAMSALEVMVGVDRSSILVLDQAGVSRFVAWRGLSDEYRAAVEGHFPWSLDDRIPRPILIPDVMQDPALTHMLPVLGREHVRAVAFIPLIYGERLIGKVMLYVDRPRVFGDEEIELANAVAYIVAFAIERTRLYAVVKEADQRKDTFLATLGHELRNPLATASAALALTAERPDDLPTYRRTYDSLARSISQMTTLVDDLLDVSRITRGVVTIEKQPVDLTSAVHHAVASVQRLISSQRQQLTLSLEELWLDADAVRLEQVISNLVHNAAKYTPAGGHIFVSTRAMNGGVEIRVKDDGIGIDPAVISQLFDLFIQVDKSLARTRGGLGIGLTIVRELVKLHGGTVTAASPGIDQGSEFTVWLPGRVVERPRTPALPREAAPRRRVLVVDDNEDAASTLAMVLELRGHDVAIAPDGPAAIAAVARQHPEVVLLDLGLPGMSGYEVAEHLRASGEKSLRIVAVSGYGQPEDVARAHAAGCDAHLAKPVDLADLERLLSAR